MRMRKAGMRLLLALSRRHAFSARTRAVYDSVLDFLGLPIDEQVELGRHNQRRAYIHRGMINFLRHPPPVLNSTMFLGKRVLNAFGIHPIHFLRKHMTAPAQHDPLESCLRSELVEEFREDTECLEALLEADLSAWKR